MEALWDEFHAAMQLLVGTGPVKQRLIDAYRRHLSRVQFQDLPDVIRERYTAFDSAMHESPATGGLTAAEASVRKMSEKDAAERTADILAMYAALTALAEADSAPHLHLVGGDDDGLAHEVHDVPAFLSRA